MKRTERRKAQRVSDYVDGLVGRYRRARLGDLAAEDREVVELTRLARALSAIRLAVPEGTRDEVAHRLAALGGRRGPRPTRKASRRTRAVR